MRVVLTEYAAVFRLINYLPRMKTSLKDTQHALLVYPPSHDLPQYFQIQCNGALPLSDYDYMDVYSFLIKLLLFARDYGNKFQNYHKVLAGTYHIEFHH